MLVQKEKNVVKIRFDDESYIISPSLKQWDKGQILKFLDIDDGAIVQFGTHGNSYIQDGQVEIPDFLMEKEGQTIIYVRFIDENSETTVKKVIIPINPKDKPKDYIEPENEQSFIQQVTEIMNETKAEADEVYEAYQRGDLNGRDGQDGAQGPQGERGPKGDKGDTGEQGAQGIQGQQGEKGEKGERGEQGQKGETGTQGPPGEDYILTQSDKEEIASIAADMVPQYDDSEIREDIQSLKTNKADKEEWEKLLDKTLQADNAIALDFSDVNFGGNYKKIRVQIRGQMSVNNSNILVYRMNSSSAYGIFGNIGKTAETMYDFEIKEKPFLIMSAIRDSTASVKSISASTNLVVNDGAIPFNQKMSETYEMKIVANSTFLAGTRVVVWGMK